MISLLDEMTSYIPAMYLLAKQGTSLSRVKDMTLLFVNDFEYGIFIIVGFHSRFLVFCCGRQWPLYPVGQCTHQLLTYDRTRTVVLPLPVWKVYSRIQTPCEMGSAPFPSTRSLSPERARV